MKTPDYELTDEEWRAFQQIPDQGYSHRMWVNRRIQERLADVWDEAAEATSEWHASYHHGDNGPPDPPRNPYED